MIPLIIAITLFMGTDQWQALSSPNGVDLDRGIITNESTKQMNSIHRSPLFYPFQLEARKDLSLNSEYRTTNPELESLNFSLIGDYNLGGNYLNASGWAVAPFGDYILLSSGGGFYVFTRNDSLRKVKEISGPGYIWDFKVRGNLVYSASGDKGLVIFDLTSLQNPRILGQLDIPYENPRYNEIFGWGATGIDLKDSFAFITVRVGGFYVVNISNPSAPIISGSNTDIRWLMDVIIKDDTLAFVTNYGPELTNGLIVYNIKNPTNPTILSTVTQIGRGRKFCILDTLAYIAARYDGMYIVNIADPAAPFIVSNLSLLDAQSAWVQAYGDTLYAFISNEDDLVVANVSDPITPYEVTTVRVRSASVFVEGNRLYDQGLFGIALYDLTFPWVPQLITYYEYLGNPLYLTARDNYAYLYDENTGYLRILDISQPKNITEVSYFTDHLDSIPSGTWGALIGGMFLEGDYIYLIVRGYPWFCYMAIVQITDPYAPVLVGTKMWRGYAGGNQLYVEDTIAYVPTALNAQTYLRILNVRNPATIQDIGLLHWATWAALEVTKRDTLLFLAGGYDQNVPQQTFYDLGIVNVARPWMPVMITEFTTPNQCRGVDRFSRAPYIAVADYESGVHIINVINPASPQITGTVDFEGRVEDVHIGRNLAFCGAGRIFAGINAENFNNPTLYGYYNLYNVISAKFVSATDVWSKEDSICLGTTNGGLFIFRTGYVGLNENARQPFKAIKTIYLLANPSRNQIQLSLDRNCEYTVRLYDITGRIKKDLTVSGKEKLEISTRGLSNGVYILQAQNANENFKKSVIILSD